MREEARTLKSDGDEQKTVLDEILARVGAPPDESRIDSKGTGMAGMIASMSRDVSELKAARTKPLETARTAVLVLPLLTAVVGGALWIMSHVRFVP